jgi:hypothetical protein
MASRTRLITRVRSGFGRKLTQQLLDHGDRVVGTVRDTSKVTALADKHPATFIAGVLEMTDAAAVRPLENQQTCIDVLCGYLRMPYEPDPGEQAAPSEWLAFRVDRGVRHTVIRIIAAHIRDGAAESWQAWTSTSPESSSTAVTSHTPTSPPAKSASPAQCSPAATSRGFAPFCQGVVAAQ